MKNNLLKPITYFLILLICVISLARISMPNSSNDVSDSSTKKISTLKTPASYRPYHDPKNLRVPYNWRRTSQTGPYPHIKRLENDLTIRVSLKGNRVYILRGNTRVYTMIASAGLFKNGKSLTPTGTFKINHNRGSSFYNPQLNEGAKNWVSWSNDDTYLFHSVPTKSNGKYNINQARKLGVQPGSHGCIRLSVPDSRWIVEHVPAETKVVIKNN
ncbi:MULTISPECIES: L,D-transpeptidase [unclassified Lactobacillus]|uniref:L,D-transpeptidase n=1 Tax=unclassified Lactobacillus TaxID=2620435 RepID=UPI000EFAAE26|nr:MULTISPECIES: L,D-transpeptidase [unclassified Lactobacillus]RMC24048.1 murein L,D-transpeptidase [Lactobacillus sp. ESL0247]RMC28402.1 murein L,D-transpeptidase [Lactobacillus sp. ESL0246]RMC31227.1 murein L,D-transpeptidase [Lactobacillus sp. ESL0245]RMC49140.1 murein L,D-transpeptidase [Lactobacillus sp. ESL0228]